MTKLSMEIGELVRGGTRFGTTATGGIAGAGAANLLHHRLGNFGGAKGAALATAIGGIGGGLLGRKLGDTVTQHRPLTYDFKSKAKEAAKIAIPGLLAAGALAALR